jgi:acyl-CoA synthetase (AMP-forming)/AMP-acid ligase II/acyl carrier protein
MSAVTTLVDVLELNRKQSRHITYLEGEHDSRRVSYQDLYQRALGILHHLQSRGARPGDKLILFLSDNEPFIDAFWAALLGGIVPVPIAIGISDEHRRKLLKVAQSLGTPWLYTEGKYLAKIAQFAQMQGAESVFEQLKARTFLIDDLVSLKHSGKQHSSQADDIAFIQFSSGSTSEPKGVVLTHANILANWRGAAEAARFSSEDVSLSWMPLTHDMGLIGFHLIMLASGVQSHLMPTELFIRRPLLWLEFATRIKASILCSPNFGYRHYLKVLGDRSVSSLDLSTVRLIFNGAEPISVHLCQEFLARLAPTKLPQRSMFPVYGLAEASLAVSFPSPGDALRTISIDRQHTQIGQPTQAVPATAHSALSLVSVGRAIPYCELQLVDDNDTPVTPGCIGHIQIRGANVTRGYFDNPVANQHALTADGWLRTGDLGLIQDHELFITGRAKEIIFINGQNYYPHDLEQIAQQAPEMELGKVVAAGATLAGQTQEELVFFLLHRSDLQDFAPLAAQVRRLINEQSGLEVAEIVPVKRIPKTTSGKVQRHLLVQSLLNGEFDAERQALRELQMQDSKPATVSRSELEQQLQDICDQALAGKRLDIHDNLFEIGASSLKLIEIHEQIEQRYPGRIELTELFDYPTIAELAQHLSVKLTTAA